MVQKKRILLKLSGTIFKEDNNSKKIAAHNIVNQIKQLKNEYLFGIVIGGGNFFRGSQQGKQLGATPTTSHYVGMIATIMNGLLLQDLLSQQSITSDLFSAFVCPEFAKPVSPANILHSLQTYDCLIFSGGTGHPYFTTDTNAVIRALEINANQVWKATDVDGIYDDDPHKNSGAKILKNISYKKAQDMNLNIMDQTAFTLAKEHGITVRVFNAFEENSILNAAKDELYGSIIT